MANRKHVEQENSILRALQKLNPKITAACQMLRHHDQDPESGSFILHVWGAEGCGKQTLVDSIKQMFERTNVIVDFDNHALPKNILAKSYAKSFFYALVNGMHSHTKAFHDKKDHSVGVKDDLMSNTENALLFWSDGDDIDEHYDRNSSSAERKHKREDDNLLLHLNALQNKGTAKLSAETLRYLETKEKEPTRSIVYEIVSLLRYLCTKKQRVLLIIRRVDTLIRAEQGILYSLLNLMADSSSSITLVTTAHTPHVNFEKRIMSRYNPFYLPMACEHPDIDAVWDSMFTKDKVKQRDRKKHNCSNHAGSTSVNLQHLYDAGWRMHVLKSLLDASENKPNKESTGTDLQLQISDIPNHIALQFDPFQRFVSDAQVPSLRSALAVVPQKCDDSLQLVNILYKWLQSVQIPLRECVALTVAVAMTFEQTSYKEVKRSATEDQPSKASSDRPSILLDEYPWLKGISECTPHGAHSACFTVDNLIQSIFPREGSVFQGFHCNQNWAAPSSETLKTNWLFTGSVFEELSRVFELVPTKAPVTHPWLSDDEWQHTIVWILSEYGILYQQSPALVSLAVPPHHCMHLVRQKLQRVHEAVRRERDQMPPKSKFAVKRLNTVKIIVTSVENEIAQIIHTYDQYFDNLMGRRNVV